MPIVIFATLDVDPALRAQFLTDADPLIQEALAEDGCAAYSWGADHNNPARVNVFEEWRDEAALRAHFAAPAYSLMVGLLQKAGMTAAEARKFRVDLIEPVYDPQGQARADFFTA